VIWPWRETGPTCVMDNIFMIALFAACVILIAWLLA
jgi:hypothetical protein